MNSLYRGPYIDASYQVSSSVHLAKEFQMRRLNCEKFTDGRLPTMDHGRTTDAK